MTGFVDVLLRALIQAAQATAVGGIVFVLFVLRPPLGRTQEIARAWGLVALGAATLAAAQTLSAVTQLIALEGLVSLHDLLVTSYVRVSAGRVATALVLLLAALVLRRRPATPARAIAIAAAVALAGLAPWTSHAAARVSGRAPLLALDALHQIAAWVWVGGLAHLVAAAVGARGDGWPVALLKRFSALALTSVGVLLAAGIGLTVNYVDGARAFVGTAYGVMVLTKMGLLGLLLALGAFNFFAVRRLARGGGRGAALRLRRFVEVELGLGLTVLGAAASLTSLPPSIDVVADRATPSEVAGRFMPRWPTFSSPPTPRAAHQRPGGAAHRRRPRVVGVQPSLVGLFVLAMGVLALLHGLGWAPWARHWPLIFLGLAVFLFLRSDPGSWPIGPVGFWRSMLFPEVLQHRIFMLLIVAFAVFEWMVRTGRLASPACSLVFPLLCSVAGALLLTHSHASLNLKAEFLIEVTHTPLGVFGILAGWARWLELRLEPADARAPGRAWAVGLAVIGLLLVLYRES